MERHTRIALRNILIGGGLLLLGAGFVGYQVTRDPMDAPMDAQSIESLQAWRLNTENRLTLEQKGRLDVAFDELRLREMGVGQVTGETNITEGVLAAIEGRTVREIVHEGLSWKCARLGVELDELNANQVRNHRFRTKPGDQASRDELERFESRLQVRIEQDRDALQEAHRELATNDGSAT